VSLWFVPWFDPMLHATALLSDCAYYAATISLICDSLYDEEEVRVRP
jgi:hypothetical protein